MFKYFMIISVTLLAIGWTAYGIWNYLEDRKEKKGGKRQTTERNQKARDSFEEYTKKMENFEKKIYDRK